MAYTPGPWTNDRGLVCGKESRERFAAGTPSDDIFDAMEWPRELKDEAMANAALIAAAPDMLAALEKCPLPNTMGSAAEHYQRFYDWYQSVAVPVIRKAGGLA